MHVIVLQAQHQRPGGLLICKSIDELALTTILQTAHLAMDAVFELVAIFENGKGCSNSKGAKFLCFSRLNHIFGHNFCTMYEYEPIVFENELRKILGLERKLAPTTIARRCRAHIGVSFIVCADIWHRIASNGKMPLKAQPKHLLWGLILLFQYPTNDAASTMLQCDPATFSKWAWAMLESIQKVKPAVVRSASGLPLFSPFHLFLMIFQILLSNRFKDSDPTAQVLMTVDCTDCQIHEPYPFSTTWFSHKFRSVCIHLF